jgi:hypothetical protein
LEVPVRRLTLLIVAAILALGAIVPATALAGKPGPNYAFSTCSVDAASDMTWTVTATGSWTGQPGGTTAGGYAYAINGATRTDASVVTFETTPAARGSAYFSATFTIDSWDSGGTASPGGYVVLGIGFYSARGALKASAETPLTFCPTLPPLMPS